LNAGVVYYIESVGTGYITVSHILGGPVFETGVAVGNVSALVSTTSIYLSSTGSGANSGKLTVSSTAGLTPGMPIVFTSTLDAIIGQNIYYILSVIDSTKITVSATFNGTKIETTSSSGFVPASVFNLTATPTYYYVRRSMILSGMYVSIGTPANFDGMGGSYITVALYRTLVGSNSQMAIVPIAGFSVTFDDDSTLTKTVYTSSQLLSAGDRIHVFTTFTPTINASNLIVQLDLF
jgi:hypothetical protein